MKKIKLGLPIFIGSMALVIGSLFAGGIKQGVKEVKADSTPTATFVGFAGDWNPAAHSGNNERYILNFNENLGENNAVNYCADIGEHFQINGESLKSISTSLRIGHNNQGANKLFIDVPTAKIVATDEYPTPIFHIDEGTPFQDYLLPELTFAINTTTYSMTEVIEITYSDYKNNEDFSNPHPSGITYSGSAPSNGAMIGVVFSENNCFNHPGTDVEIHTSTWGKNVFINGTPLADVDGAVVGVYVNRLYVFVPTAYLTFTNPAGATMHSTIYVKRALYGNCIIPAMNFFYNGTVGSTGGWTKQTGPNNVTFSQIRWNNTDYSNYGGHNGLLLQYSANLAQRGDYFNGGLDKVNLINYGAFNIDTNIKLNGIAFKDIDGAEVFYKSENLLWVYAPGMGTKGNVLEIVDVQAMDSYLPNQYFLFDTSWAVVNEDVFNNVVSFVDTYMHMDANVTGQCVTYYPNAKSAYSSLSNNAKMVFTNNATFSAAFNRLSKWATYHSETFDGGAFTANPNVSNAQYNLANSIVPILVSVEMIIVILAVGLLFIKKRKRG